jgi:hypothetical protein
MSGCLDGWTLGATLPARATLRQRDPPLGAALLAGESEALVGGQRGKVDRRLRIGREHDQRLAVRQLGQRPAGADQRQRAVEAAGVEGSYDQDMMDACQAPAR